MRRLSQLRRYRKTDAHSYSFGVFPTLELLTHRPHDVQRVVLHSQGEKSEGVAKIRALCGAHDILVETNDKAVENLSHKGNIYAFGVFDKYDTPLEADANHLLLVSPSDHGNLGTISRTMLAFGVRDLAIIPPAADVFNPHVVRASMGAIFALRCQTFENLSRYREAFPHALYPFMLGAHTPLQEATFTSPCTFVFGPEGAGLPSAYAERGHSVRIEQSPLVESLNLAVAVSVALYAVQAKRTEATEN